MDKLIDKLTEINSNKPAKERKHILFVSTDRSVGKQNYKISIVTHHNDTINVFKYFINYKIFENSITHE